MEWTREPTEEGWYWMWAGPGCTVRPEFIRIDENGVPYQETGQLTEGTFVLERSYPTGGYWYRMEMPPLPRGR